MDSHHFWGWTPTRQQLRFRLVKYYNSDRLIHFLHLCFGNNTTHPMTSCCVNENSTVQPFSTMFGWSPLDVHLFIHMCCVVTVCLMINEENVNDWPSLTFIWVSLKMTMLINTSDEHLVLKPSFVVFVCPWPIFSNRPMSIDVTRTSYLWLATG